jgi:hypothetical protein
LDPAEFSAQVDELLELAEFAVVDIVLIAERGDETIEVVVAAILVAELEGALAARKPAT